MTEEELDTVIHEQTRPLTAYELIDKVEAEARRGTLGLVQGLHAANQIKRLVKQYRQGQEEYKAQIQAVNEAYAKARKEKP